MDNWYAYNRRKKVKEKDPNISSQATRKYVRGISEALGIPLEKKLMKREYCQTFIYEHKIAYLQYLNEHGIIPPPSEKQKRYIIKIQKVLNHHYKDSELSSGFSNIEEAKKYIKKWQPIYYSIVGAYYAANKK